MDNINDFIASITRNKAFRVATSMSPEVHHVLERLPTSSYVLGCLGLAYLANRWLTDRALNNRTASDKWDWPREIIVVTGGAGGIGAEIVKSLAAKRSRVIVLDVLSLTYPKRASPKQAECYDE